MHLALVFFLRFVDFIKQNFLSERKITLIDIFNKFYIKFFLMVLKRIISAQIVNKIYNDLLQYKRY